MGRDKLLLVAAFVFFTLYAIGKGFDVSILTQPWMIPGGLAAWVLSELQ